MPSLKAAFSLKMLAFSALLTAGLIAAPVRAQSDSDLRKQNQELTTKVQDLQAELDAANKNIDALKKRIAQLEAQLAARGPGGASSRPGPPPLEQDKVTVDESKPAASPRSLFNAAVESYKKAVGDSPMGKADDKDRIAYMRKLERWKPATERELRLPIEWHVRLIEARPPNIAIFQTVDPVTDARLGDTFEVKLPRSVAARLEELVKEGHGDPGVMVLKGTSVVSLNINADRQTPGSFDNPRFVGPFAEFQFGVEPLGVASAKPAPASTQPANKPTTKPAAPSAKPEK